MDEIILITCLVTIFIVFLNLIFPHQDRSKLHLEVIYNNLKINGEIQMIGLKSTQKVRVKLLPVDRLGNPSQVEQGTVRFASSVEITPANAVGFSFELSEPEEQ